MLFALIILSHAEARADAVYAVTVNTSGLTTATAQAGAPFFIDFQFNPGSQPNNNSVVVSNFSFGTGGGIPAGSVPTFIGTGASGSLQTGFVLNDSGATGSINAATQRFTPGDTLRFQIRLTTAVDSRIPDLFAFSILQGDPPLNIMTNDPSFADTLFTIEINRAFVQTGAVQTFASIDPRFPIANPQVQPIPEPATLALLGSGLIGCAVRNRRRREGNQR